MEYVYNHNFDLKNSVLKDKFNLLQGQIASAMNHELDNQLTFRLFSKSHISHQIDIKRKVTNKKKKNYI